MFLVASTAHGSNNHSYDGDPNIIHEKRALQHRPGAHHKSILLSALIAAGPAVAPVAPAAFADNIKKDTMTKDSMSKDSMKKDDGMPKDSMKKHDGMAKDNMSKDSMKK
jgi:pentapeptide MXKDX repeat protein